MKPQPKYRLPLRHALAGWMALFCLYGGSTVGYADILRSGAARASAPRNAQARQSAGAEAAAYAQQVQQDRLAKTTQALTAMRNMQAAARAAAMQGPNNLGLNPNDPSQTLPNVVNGLGPNGLQVDVLNPRWEGANAPTQSQDGGRTTVNIRQTAQQAILHWSKFNVGKQTTVNFDQRAGGADAGKWVAFNRITDPTGQPSQILGRINAQGQVYIINQNGIIFGGSSQVNARGLVASSLSLNMDQVARGILNQEPGNVRFLLDGSLRDLTVNGGRIGDVTVLPGAILGAPTNEAKSGGRVVLAGPNVTNRGRILTPDGQTILAAGLQIGFTPHSADDPSLRGLDVFVGRVSGLNDLNNVAVETVAATAGRVTQAGLIEAARGHIALAGRAVNQAGFLESSTSVSLNGRMDILAFYNSLVNPQFGSGSSIAFVPTETGTVRLESGSVMRILPEWASDEKTVGTRLALDSQINLQGRNIYFGTGSILQAPSARVNARAGIFNTIASVSSVQSTLVFNQGQVYLDRGTLLDVAGSTNVRLPLTQNILQLELRGAELARSPLQRSSILRGLGLAVDLRRTGTYAGWDWVGTPLGDVSGYVALIQRGVGELTVNGGTVNLQAGDSVVTRAGSVIDVSGGWIDWQGANIITSRVRSGNQIFDISEALPDRVYDGLFSATWTRTNEKYGLSSTFRIPLVYTGERYEPGYISGGNAGSVALQAPAMALDGRLSARVVEGPRQLRSSVATSDLPQGGALDLRFVGERRNPGRPLYLEASPTPPSISFADGTFLPAPGEFTVDADDNAPLLGVARSGQVVLSPRELEEEGFQFLRIDNGEGPITIGRGVTVRLRPGGGLDVNASAVNLEGSIVIPGGRVSLMANNSSPYDFAQELLSALPALNPSRGYVRVAPGAVIDVAGLRVDDRPTALQPGRLPIVLDGGDITLEALSVRLEAGSALNASAGLLAFVNGGRTTLTSGNILYGNGGSIGLLAGLDPAVSGQIGGELLLLGNYAAYGGLSKEGGELRLRAQQVQVGGAAPGNGILHLPVEFFQRGGFSTFALSGVGRQISTGRFAPALHIVSGTRLSVAHQSLAADPFQADGSLGTRLVVAPDGNRTPTRFAFSAAGATDSFSGLQRARGSVILQAGAEILAGPRGEVGFQGQTVDILGRVYAPGGKIAVAGATRTSSAFPDALSPLVTVYLGPQSVLSTAGDTFSLVDALGRRRGVVLPGGSISVQGNLAAVAGAVLDVSGTRGELDLTPAELGLLTGELPVNSGLNRPLISVQGIPTWLESDGGSITLRGGEMLYSSASLRGFAGGPSALGGSLAVSSGRFTPDGNRADNQINLTVSERLPILTAGMLRGTGASLTVGGITPGWGYFAATDFRSGGFDLLDLPGNVEFVGPLILRAARGLRVATGGVLRADSRVELQAPYVSLGQVFQTPLAPGQTNRLFQQVLAGTPSELFFPPTFGPGSLVVRADLIDLGTLSFQNIGSVRLAAPTGDIRGSGTVHIRGKLELEAGQVYPTTATALNLIAYDPNAAAGDFGSIVIRGGSLRPAPFSAGGRLNLYATRIEQLGVLRAPFGAIQLGWDGLGSAPVDPIAGNTIPFPITTSLTLGRGSLTSVTGAGLQLPYGVTPDGNSWIDPQGVDITASGLQTKGVSLSAAQITTEAGSLVDLRGGGNLFAYRFIPGNGGPEDILGQSNRFAILPGYGFGYAPFSPFNPISGDPGFVDRSLRVGDKIFLGGSTGLAAGYYTLLPARYALLPGAFLVTPSGNAPLRTVERLDGSRLVGGFRDSGLGVTRSGVVVRRGFEVLPAAVVRDRAEYEVLFANEFLSRRAQELGAARQELPLDAGRLNLQARTGLTLRGGLATSADAGGKGARVDLSTPTDIWIGNSPSGVPAGTTFLDSKVLSSWNADSLLIGGSRSMVNGHTLVQATSGRVTVANAGRALTGPEILLVAKEGLFFNAGSSVLARGGAAGSPIRVEGDGVLARVSSAATAETVRSGVNETAAAQLSLGSGVRLSGRSVILDSAAGFVVDPTAGIASQNVSLRAGRISLELNSPGALQPNPGLVIEGGFRDALQSAGVLDLLSYSSLDFYGQGSFGGNLRQLTLGARQLRGFNSGGGDVILQAERVRLQNPSANILSGTPAAASGDLLIRSGVLELGGGKMVVDQFAAVKVQATRGVYAVASGETKISGDLAVNTPVVSGRGNVNFSLESSGSMDWVGGLPTPPAAAVTGLGTVWQLTGDSVNLQSAFVLPSGGLLARARSGDLIIGANGLLDVSGTRQAFFDQVRYTDGGEIELVADAGSVHLQAGAAISVAARPEGGNAGTLSVFNPQGSFIEEGQLFGSAGAGQRQGSFVLDTAGVPALGALNTALANGGFTASRNLRIRQGDVVIDHHIRSRDFTLSADAGSITLTGSGAIDASGVEGGSVSLWAARSLTLQAGSSISVAAERFDSAGKGGRVTLGAGAGVLGVSDPSAVLDFQTGATIDLRVADYVPGDYLTVGSSAFRGRFEGTLHLRAPQTADYTDVQMAALGGEVLGGSSILVEGFRIYDLGDYGGFLNTYWRNRIKADGEAFLGVAGVDNGASKDAAIRSRLLSLNPAAADRLVLAPGAEFINTAAAANTNFSLQTVGANLVIPATGGSVLFPNGTVGASRIRSSSVGVITTASGEQIELPRNTNVALAPGSTVTLAIGGTLSYAGSAAGTMSATLLSGQAYETSGAGASVRLAERGAALTLQTPASSVATLAAGTKVALPNGTIGSQRLTSSAPGLVTLPDGTSVALAANSPTIIPAGAYVTLSAGGTLRFTGGTTGVGMHLALVSGELTSSGEVAILPATSGLRLGQPNRTGSSSPEALAVADWDLSSFRFGQQRAPGVLTLRASGDLVFNNTLSDGFNPITPATNAAFANAGNSYLWLAPLQTIVDSLPTNTQSWSYRLVAGADLLGSNPLSVRRLTSLPGETGRVMIGELYPAVPNSTTTGTGAGVGRDGQTADTIRINSEAVTTNVADRGTRFEVVRTGTGTIEIQAARDLWLRNQFATVYTAGVAVPQPSRIFQPGDFSVPINIASGVHPDQATLGIPQQNYPAQFAMAGGSLHLSAGQDISRVTLYRGEMIPDTSRQIPTNWLYRRGFVNAAGVFGTTQVGALVDPAASTAWWVDYSNFFQGFGALAGGHIQLKAGRDIVNADAAIATQARMAGRDSSGNPVAPNASALLEYGGGDLLVQAGRNVDGGVYYVESGSGRIGASGEITTNAARSPSLGILAGATPTILDPGAWQGLTLFGGRTQFDVRAKGNVLLGPVGSAFLLPQGIGNKFWYKTQFNTLDADSALRVSSLGGDVTHRLSVTSASDASPTPILGFLTGQYTALSPLSIGYYQPWIRLAEPNTGFFNPLFTIGLPSLESIAYAGDVRVAGVLNLAPSPSANLNLFARGSVLGLQPIGAGARSSLAGQVWTASRINLSDANPANLRTVTTPLAYQQLVGGALSDLLAIPNAQNPVGAIAAIFDETGSFTGAAASITRKQNLHAPGLLHRNSADPVRIYAAGGDISGFTLFSGKFSRIVARRDVTDIAFYLQNSRAFDHSIVSAGRDLIAYNSNSVLRARVNSAGNLLANQEAPLAGDLQISGPGTLQVLAGRNLDLGTGGQNADGTGAGIVSIGNARNPFLPAEGANLIVGAGLGQAAASLFSSPLAIADFLRRNTSSGNRYLTELGIRNIETLPEEEQARAALGVFFLILRDAGRAAAGADSPLSGYADGFRAIDELFGGGKSAGNLLLRSRDVRTKAGGDIQMFAASGGLEMASTQGTGNNLIPPGVVSESGGRVNVFTDRSVSIGIGRIFTLRGGDIIIWSSNGDIAAGSSSKTVQSAPPTRVVIDPQSGLVETDLAGLATGGGIGVLATVAGVRPGNVDLVAPQGVVDAGDAGIQSSGNLIIAATAVVNASNIAVGGISAGAAAPAAPSGGAAPVAAAPPSPTAANNQAAESMTTQSVAQVEETEAAPSIYTVEILGYGGSEDEEDEDEDEDERASTPSQEEPSV